MLAGLYFPWNSTDVSKIIATNPKGVCVLLPKSQVTFMLLVMFYLLAMLLLLLNL